MDEDDNVKSGLKGLNTVKLQFLYGFLSIWNWSRNVNLSTIDGIINIMVYMSKLECCSGPCTDSRWTPNESVAIIERVFVSLLWINKKNKFDSDLLFHIDLKIIVITIALKAANKSDPSPHFFANTSSFVEGTSRRLCYNYLQRHLKFTFNGYITKFKI